MNNTSYLTNDPKQKPGSPKAHMKIARSLSNNNSTCNSIKNNSKERSDGFTQFVDQKQNNEKSQHDAGIRRFIKKVVTRIVKKIYLAITTSRLPNAINFRDFSHFNL